VRPYLFPLLFLRQQSLDHFAMNVGQPAIDSIVSHCQSLMVDTQQM
jgi:hypothetical protein